jgi:hypothetical protein
MQTVRGLLGDEIEEDVKEWTQNRADAIRQPIEIQYSDLEKELGVILEDSARAQAHESLKERRSRWLGMFVTAAAGATILGLKGAHFIEGTFTEALIFGLSGLALYFSLNIILSNLNSDRATPKTASRLDLAKLNRRREVIEERLKKLETLRAADPESLLRNRGND